MIESFHVMISKYRLLDTIILHCGGIAGNIATRHARILGVC